MLSLDEQKSLIEKFVRANKNFKGNEDLFDDFCAESMQKSYMIFNSVANSQKVESYINKVVHTSILTVLKNYGRIRREKAGYVSSLYILLFYFFILPLFISLFLSLQLPALSQVRLFPAALHVILIGYVSLPQYVIAYKLPHTQYL